MRGGRGGRLLPTMGTLINIGALKLGINALDASQGKSERLYVDYDSVPIETIDSLGLERLDLIKVDAQGFEEKVLRGAREAIKRHLPDIYMEYGWYPAHRIAPLQTDRSICAMRMNDGSL